MNERSEAIMLLLPPPTMAAFFGEFSIAFHNHHPMKLFSPYILLFVPHAIADAVPVILLL